MNFFSLLLLTTLSFALSEFNPAENKVVKKDEQNPTNHHDENNTKKDHKNTENKTPEKRRNPPAAPYANYKTPEVHHKVEKPKNKASESTHHKIEILSSSKKLNKSESQKHLEKTGSLQKESRTTLQDLLNEEPNKKEHSKDAANKLNPFQRIASTLKNGGQKLLPLKTRRNGKDGRTKAVREFENGPGHSSHTAETAFYEGRELRRDLTTAQARIGQVDEMGRNTKALAEKLEEDFGEEQEYNEEQHQIHHQNQGILNDRVNKNDEDIGILRVDHQNLDAKHQHLDERFTKHEETNANEHNVMEKGIEKNVEDIGELNKGLASQDARLTVNENGLENLNTEHGKLTKTVEGQGERLGNAEGKITDHDREITQLHTTDTNLGQRIEGAEKVHRDFVTGEFNPHVEGTKAQFKIVGDNIDGLNERQTEFGRVQGEHGVSINNLETNLGNEEKERISGDNLLSQKIVDETTPIREQANRVEASLGHTIKRVDENTGLLGTHREKLNTHHGRLNSAERRLGENDVKFGKHVTRIQKRKRDIRTMQQRFMEMYGNMDKLAIMQQNIDGNMLSMEEQFARNLAKNQQKVEDANRQLAEANHQVSQTIEEFLQSLRASQTETGTIGQLNEERAQLIRAQFRVLEEEERDRVHHKLAKGNNVAPVIDDEATIAEAAIEGNEANVENVDVNVEEQSPAEEAQY